MATDPDKENRHPNIVVHIPAAAATDERRRRRDEAFAGLTAPALTSKRLYDEFVELRTRMYAKWREHLDSVNEERAERDHREPGPLSG